MPKVKLKSKNNRCDVSRLFFKKITAISLLISGAFLFILSSSPLAVATSGYLRSNTIVECNGKYYGIHGKDNKEHWHEATKSTDGRWHAEGSELAGNPCKSSSEEKTNGDSSQSTKSNNNETAPSTNGSQTNNDASSGTTLDNSQNSQSSDETQTVEVASPEQAKKNSQSVELRVWIEDEASPIHFSNNTYTAKTRLNWENELHYKYELSSEDVSLAVKKDGEYVEGPIKLDDGENKISFIIESENGEEAVFEMMVKKCDFLSSAIIVFLATTILVILGGVIASAIKVYVLTKRNRKETISVYRFFKSLLKKENIIKILLPPVYLIMMEKHNKKVNISLFCWLAIWALIIGSVIATMTNSHANPTIRSANGAPSATIKIETTVVENQREDNIETIVAEKTEANNTTGSKVSADVGVSKDKTSNDLMSGVEISEAIDAEYSRKEYEPN